MIQTNKTIHILITILLISFLSGCKSTKDEAKEFLMSVYKVEDIKILEVSEPKKIKSPNDDIRALISESLSMQSEITTAYHDAWTTKDKEERIRLLRKGSELFKPNTFRSKIGSVAMDVQYLTFLGKDTNATAIEVKFSVKGDIKNTIIFYNDRTGKLEYSTETMAEQIIKLNSYYDKLTEYTEKCYNDWVEESFGKQKRNRY